MCVLTENNKLQSCPCAESISWDCLEVRGFGQKGGYATCSLGMGGIREVEKRRSWERRLQGKDRAEEGEIEQRLGE